MAVPVPTNTTGDIYHNGNAPRAAPDVSAVNLYLTADWVGGMEHGENRSVSLNYTHVALLDYSVDVRDIWQTGGINQAGTGPMIYIPNQNGTGFNILFIERVMRGTAQDHKRVWLQRAPGVGTNAVPWPTNNL